MAPAGIVISHDMKIRPTTLKSIADIPRAIPTPRTAPTNVCVVETGMPVPEAMTIVVAAASSAASRWTGRGRWWTWWKKTASVEPD